MNNTSEEMKACPHERENEGPRIPLRYGSAATMVCSACGAWRQSRIVPVEWYPAEELARSFCDDEEAMPSLGNTRPAPSGDVERVARALWMNVHRRDFNQTPEDDDWEIDKEDDHPLVLNAFEDARAAIAALPDTAELREITEAVGETLDKDFAFWSSPTQNERRSRLFNAWKGARAALQAIGQEGE